MDEQRLERALRQGPPFATGYVPSSLALDEQPVVRGSVSVGRLVVIIAVTALLLVGMLAGLAALGAFRDEIRVNGEILMFARRDAGSGWDLAAQDPETREVRTIVETDGIIACPSSADCTNFVKTAMWSSDGRWVAFEVSFDSLDLLPHNACGPTAGLWVQDAIGEPRQLTTPCDTPPPGAPESDIQIEELWAWSPVGARLATSRVDGATDELFVIDPSDGRRTSLGAAEGDLTALEWSPDGTRVAYADGASVHVVPVDGGERSLLADSFAYVMNIDYSPDGAQIMVRDLDHTQGRYRMWVMNADGSDLHVLLEGRGGYDETAWSPNGDRILYQLSFANGPSVHFDSEVWTVAPDGSNEIKVFDSDGCDMGETQDALPVWAPNGAQVAYNACGVWVVVDADGTGEPQRINRLLHRSWAGGGLSGWDLPVSNLQPPVGP